MKSDRLITILMILLNTKRTTAKLLSQQLEVSVRTIYRDLDSLLVAGVPVNTIQGINGGIYIDENFKLDNSYFSTSEIIHLLHGLNGVENIFNDKGVNTTYEKIKHLVPDNKEKEIYNSTQKIEIDLTSWQEHESNIENLQIVKKALDNNQELIFDYIDKSGNQTSRNIEPYKLIFKELNWYIEGFCLEKKSFRVFKLSRMLNLTNSMINFTPRGFIPADNSVNGWIKDKLFYITVIFNQSILEMMIKRCGEKNIRLISNNSYEAEMPFTDDEYSYNLLLSFGKNIRCIKPNFVVNKLRKHINEISNIYK